MNADYKSCLIVLLYVLYSTYVYVSWWCTRPLLCYLVIISWLDSWPLAQSCHNGVRKWGFAAIYLEKARTYNCRDADRMQYPTNSDSSVRSERNNDVWLIWVFASDEQWYLCCTCSYCEALMQYPGAPHRCPAYGSSYEGVIELEVIGTSPTSMQEIAGGLMCRETFLSIEDW